MIADSLQAEALLEYICQHPAEDDARLVHADVLEERGEGTHGEFIRVGVELAGMRPAEWCVREGDDFCRQTRRVNCRRCFVRRRERELFARHGDDWCRPLTAILGGDVLLSCTGIDPSDVPNYSACVRVRRGFPCEVSLTAESFCRHAAALFRMAPIEVVTFPGKRPEYHLTGGGASWSWYCVGFANDSATLPPELLHLLPGGKPGMGAERRIYPTGQAALDALAAAALLLGRRRGWPCPRCLGEGKLYSDMPRTTRTDCPDCFGLGHTVTG